MTDGVIGFVLCSSFAKPLPSTRIAVIKMMPFLQAAGLKTCVLFEPLEPTETPNLIGVAERAIEANCKVVVLQKVRGLFAEELVFKLSAAGIRTIFLVCDHVDLEMASITDATIVISDFLKSLYPPELHSRIFVVHDGIENPDVFKKDWGAHNTPLNAVLVTSQQLDHLPEIAAPPSWLNVRIVGHYRKGLKRLQEMHWAWNMKNSAARFEYLAFLLNKQIACVPWSYDGVYSEMLRADIGIIPISTTLPSSTADFPPDWMKKSENRLTLKMCMALPVIATPIPAYEAVIDHGVNGFFARSQKDWNTCLNALRDPELRREIGINARASVVNKFSMELQAAKFANVILQNTTAGKN